MEGMSTAVSFFALYIQKRTSFSRRRSRLSRSREVDRMDRSIFKRLCFRKTDAFLLLDTSIESSAPR